MLINCDIGERGSAHPIDDAIMPLIDIANIACGGHAGDAKSILHYRHLAEIFNIKITAHLSYPDWENFGRRILNISIDDLLNSLDQQYSLMPDIKAVKLHGALYNQANKDTELANAIANWFKDNHISEVLTQSGSELATACQKLQIKILPEAFLDRRYILENNQPQICPRSQANALIHNPNDALEQYKNFLAGFVEIDNKEIPLAAETICLHSDSSNAIEILKAVRNV